MSRFYFHTEDGIARRDEEGVELATLAEARREAVRVLGGMLRDQPDDIWTDGGLKLTVADEDNLLLFVLEVSATASAAGGADLRRP